MILVMLWLIISYALLTLTAGLTGYFAIKLSIAFRKFQLKKSVNVPTKLDEVPSVSICVPARNEKHAMTQFLERVLASDYPKFEIIVHDDESADETSVLVKSFAHAGVRFVEGSPLPEGWLGKNNALQSLLSEASGKYVLFMDVDTVVNPDTIGQLVSYAEQEDAAMVSVLPSRRDGYRFNVIFGTLRYFWELVRYTPKTPAASSSAWMVNREKFIADFTDFSFCKNDIQPETIIAKHYAALSTYRFVISGPTLGLSYEKKWMSQIQTSIRISYPLSGGRLFKAVPALIFMLLLNVPLLTLIFGAILRDGHLVYTSLAVHLFAIIFYSLYLMHVREKGWLLGALVWPYLVLQELVIYVLSIYMYKTNRVTWKGRPITLSR